MRRTLLLAVVLLAVVPTAAHGAAITLADITVQEGHTTSTIVVGTTLTYEAVPGEANDLTIQRADTRLLIGDTGATITAPGCTPAAPGQFSCPVPSDLIVRLGDRDDRATLGDGLDTESNAVDGGAGNDVLRGGDGAERLTAGDGRDQLDGGAGNDVLVGTETDAQPDLLAGGAGTDRVSYDGQPQAVRLDLAARTATGRGIGTDMLTDVEDARGGSAADVLLGDTGDNVLVGGPGPDTLRGGAGDDHLWGEVPGEETGGFRDRIDAGPGDDLIWLPRGEVSEDDLYGTVEEQTDGRVDTVTCGPGADAVSYAGPEDVLPVSCEHVSDREAIDPDATWLALPPAAAGRATLVLRASLFGGRPQLRSLRGTLLGAVTRRVAPDVRATLRFTLTPAGRRVAARRVPIVVRLGGLRDSYGFPAGDLTIALPRL